MLGRHAPKAADALGAEGRMGAVRLWRIGRKEITRWVRKNCFVRKFSSRVRACALSPPTAIPPILTGPPTATRPPAKSLIRRQTAPTYQQNHPNLKNRISESKKVYACARVRETLTRVHFPYRITALGIKKNPPTLPGKWM